MISFSLICCVHAKNRMVVSLSFSISNTCSGATVEPYIEDALYAEVCSECNCTKIMHAHYLSVFYLKHDTIGQCVRHEYAECMN